MNGRVYDPVIARFLSPDPYVQAADYSQNFNIYSYTLNNPLIYVDHNGKFFTSLFLGPVGLFIDAFLWGAVIDYTIQVATNYLTRSPDDTAYDILLGDIDFADMIFSGAASAATLGLNKIGTGLKIAKHIKKIEKGISLTSGAASSWIDWKPFSRKDERGIKFNSGSDFWVPFTFNVIKANTASQGSQKIANAITNGLESNDLMEIIIHEAIEIPASVATGWLSHQYLNPSPPPEEPLVIPPPHELNPDDRYKSETGELNNSIRFDKLIKTFSKY